MVELDRLWQRAGLLQAVRLFFVEQGFLEVDTPIRLPACAPEPFIEPEESGDWFLQTSPELAMKRLLAAGAGKIFQICKCFRKNERGSLHLPEFTMLEWYRTKNDYHALMEDCEDLLLFLAAPLPNAPMVEKSSGPTLKTADRLISLKKPWERLTVAEAFRRHAKMSVSQALADDLFDQVLCRDIEPHLGQQRPCLLYGYPAALASLARLNPKNPAVAERFELYINGLEIANGFSELTDPAEQRARFLEDREKIRLQGRNPGPMPEKFLTELDQIPGAAGIALGLDRLALLFLGVDSIDQAVTFTPETL